MKQALTLCIIFLLLLQLVQGQEIDTHLDQPALQSYDMYMQKHKTNKTIAWVMLGSGLIMMTSGINTALDHILSDGNEGETLILTGIGTSFMSIPFFSAAKRNKRKAREAEQKAKIGFGHSTINKNKYMLVTLTISL